VRDWSCIVIAGPTASGKTALAAELAHRLGSEIFSMDSRQVYRGLDLGSGKDLAVYANYNPPVPYHLIDIVDPSEIYSLYRFQVDSYVALEEFLGRRGEDVPPVLAGGTGLYLEAVLKRYAIAEVPENPELRAELMTEDTDSLIRELKTLSEEVYARTDLTSKKRIVRALEIVLSPRGTVFRSRLPDWNLNPLIFVTVCERQLLRQRIQERLKARLDEGLVDEVKGLHERGLTWERLASLGMEYRQVASHLRGEKSLGEMADDLIREIHLLAKRQETYFRGMERRGLTINWISPDTGAEELESRYEEWKRVGSGTAAALKSA
jgi:tRNA dimethylallyltransferase